MSTAQERLTESTAEWAARHRAREMAEAQARSAEHFAERSGRPIPDLEFESPPCPICAVATDADGDGFWCDVCAVQWDKRGACGERDADVVAEREPVGEPAETRCICGDDGWEPHVHCGRHNPCCHCACGVRPAHAETTREES